jgi:glycosyltransferase involved in cell wall biosynthesis
VAVNFLQDYDPWFYTDEQLKERSLASYPMIDHRVVTSHWLQGLLEERGFSSTVIPLGFNAKEFYPSATREARLARAGERAAAPLRVVAMARPHTPYRGFDDLLAAMRAVHARRPAVEIALFGCDQLSDHGEIDFPVVNLGTIRDRVELCRQYNESDVFVDASHFQGFGLPALEAMSCGVACVLTNVGGVNQYARDGRNALMVPPHSPPRLADAVVRLLDEEPLRRRVADEGRRTVEGMSPAAEAIAWRDYLAKVCPQFRRKWIPARRRLAA